MDVTVAICTWNRAALLDRSLGRLGELALPEALAWEVLVVDNGSDDDTQAVIARHADRLPLRAAREPQRGLSRARNRAVAEARGALLAWTDDDVLVEPDWLAAYAAAAREHSDAVFFGGPVLPLFEAAPPDWLAAALPVVGSAFALCDLGDAGHALGPERLPYGANFAVRTAVQRDYPFDPELGRRGEELIAGDEADVLRRMLTDGHAGRWLPEARVRHIVPRERMSLDYVCRYYRGIGRTDVRVHQRVSPRWWRLLDSGARACLKGTRGRLARLLGRTPDWVRDLRDASIHWGRFEAVRARTRAGRSE